MAASVAGASASPWTSGSTVRDESAHGRVENCASSTVLPTGLPSSLGNTPRARMNSSTESARVAIDTSPINEGVLPKPGRSMAITSRCAANPSMIGFQERQVRTQTVHEQQRVAAAPADMVQRHTGHAGRRRALTQLSGR